MKNKADHQMSSADHAEKFVFLFFSIHFFFSHFILFFIRLYTNIITFFNENSPDSDATVDQELTNGIESLIGNSNFIITNPFLFLFN